MSETARCDRCGAALKCIAEREIGPGHTHREYECPGCLHQYPACSAEGFKLIRHHGH